MACDISNAEALLALMVLFLVEVYYTDEIRKTSHRRLCVSDFDSLSSPPSEPFASRAVTMGQTSSMRDLCHRLGGVFSSRQAATSRSFSNDDDPKRVINIHNGPQPTKFRSNRISTSKYSPLTFLPKFLFGQFRKYSNVFFLCIVLFQVRSLWRRPDCAWTLVF